MPPEMNPQNQQSYTQDQVQFDEGDPLTALDNYQPQQVKMPLLNRMVIKTGLAKSEMGSNVVLVIIMIIFFLASIFIFMHYVLGVNFGISSGSQGRSFTIPTQKK